MVENPKKTTDKQSASASAGLFDSQLAQAVRESAQQIWLAGMGAFAKAQAEGGKVFETLVQEGSNLQRKTQATAEERFSDVAGKVTAMAEGVSARAGQQWDKLESIFEQRVDKALGRLGVPSGEDLKALEARIDALAAQVAALGRKPKAAKATHASTTPKAGTGAAARKARARPAVDPGSAGKPERPRRPARKTSAG